VKLKYLLLRKEYRLRMFVNGAEEKQQEPRETCIVCNIRIIKSENGDVSGACGMLG